MDSWRIKVRNFDRSQVPAIAEKKAAAMVIRAPKGPNTPLRFAKGNTDYIRDVFGDPSPEYPQIWEALEYNQYGPIWLSSPYQTAAGKEDRLPGVMVTTTAVTAFTGGAGPIPAAVAAGTYVVDGALDLFAVLAKSPYAGGDLAIAVTHFMNPLALDEHLFSLKVYKINSVGAWIEVESYSELSFNPEAKNAAGTRIYMPIRIEKSKYVQVVLKDISVWPTPITLTSTTAVTIAGGTRTDINLLGEVLGALITPAVEPIPVDFDTESTFSWELLDTSAENALLAISTNATLAAGLVYKVLPAGIDREVHATFAETKLTLVSQIPAVRTHVYAVTQTGVPAVDFDTPSTFSWVLLSGAQADALVQNDLDSVTDPNVSYYSVVTAAIVRTNHLTFVETKINTVVDLEAAIALGTGTCVYQVTQTEPGSAAVYAASTWVYNRSLKVAIINLCWDEYKKKTQYPADLFLDDTGFIEVATKFNTLRGNPDGTGGYQKYSYYLHRVSHTADEDFAALQTTAEGYATAIDNLGLAYFVNECYIYDAYVGKEYWTSGIGRIGIKYAAMEDIYDGLAPAGLDENGHGGQLSVVGSGPHIKKLRHYYDDDQDTLLDSMCINPILWDPGVGAFIGGQKTAQNPKKWTDYTYVNFARATDYIRRNIVQKSLVNQLWKLMDANHRFMVISGCEAIIKPVLAAGILDDAIVFVTATDETNSQRKFVLNVAVRTTPTAEYIEFNFTNVGQGVDVKSVQS